jgi:tetratricopeptide (TPR) repeat protein
MVSATLAVKRYVAPLLVGLLLSGCAAFPEREQPVPRPGPEREEPPDEGARDTDDGKLSREGIETAVYTPPTSEPESLQKDYPRSAGEVSGPAVTSLYRKARQSASRGDHASAIALLERALRIEPRNPFVWTALAEQHLAAEHYSQAENSAARANGFARGNPYLEARNWRVIADARRGSGDRNGAEQAHERAEQARLRQGGGG